MNILAFSMTHNFNVLRKITKKVSMYWMKKVKAD